MAVILSLMFGVVSVVKGRSQPSPRFLLLANALLRRKPVFVEHRGLEPLTSTLQRWHSTN